MKAIYYGRKSGEFTRQYLNSYYRFLNIGGDNIKIKGKITITNDDWKWNPNSLRENDVKKLADDLKKIKKFEEVPGKIFQKHIKNADVCEKYSDNPEMFAECLTKISKLNEKKHSSIDI